jgi:hypothetical protein
MIDPRIVTLAKDPRTAPVLLSIVESGGRLAQTRSAVDLAAFGDALRERGFDWADPVGSELLAYLGSVADELAQDNEEAARAVAVLREDVAAFWRFRADTLVGTTDTLVDIGLLTPDEEPAPLEITPLGRAVLLVLEQRLPPALPEPVLDPIERLLVNAGR